MTKDNGLFLEIENRLADLLDDFMGGCAETWGSGDVSRNAEGHGVTLRIIGPEDRLIQVSVEIEDVTEELEGEVRPEPPTTYHCLSCNTVTLGPAHPCANPCEPYGPPEPADAGQWVQGVEPEHHRPDVFDREPSNRSPTPADQGAAAVARDDAEHASAHGQSADLELNDPERVDPPMGEPWFCFNCHEYKTSMRGNPDSGLCLECFEGRGGFFEERGAM